MNIEVICTRLNTMPAQRLGEYRLNLTGAVIEAPDIAAQWEMLSLVDESVLRDYLAEQGLALTKTKAVA